MIYKENTSLKTFRIFIFIYLPLFLLLSIIIITYYLNNNKMKLETAKKYELHYVNLLNEVINRKFSGVISDLFIISNLNSMSEDIFNSYHKRLLLSLELYAFLKARKVYDQIRILDKKGNEIVRINRNDGYPEIVDEHKLQNKKDRYYFKDIFKLKKSEVYVSEFDLNLEHDKVEIPFKPMIRFGISILNSYGEKSGILVINYFGNDILNDLRNVNRKVSHSDLYLLNKDGYFLLSPNVDEEWTFMFKNKKQYLFKDFDSDAWNIIVKNKSGQFINKKGLYTFKTIYIDDMDFVSQDLGFFIKAKSHQLLRLVSFYSKQSMENNEGIIKLSYLFSYLILISILLFIPSVIFAKLIRKKMILNEQLKFNANYDALTNLPNRNLFFDRLEIVLSYSERYKQKFAIFYMDLDDFKDVNDNYGHEAGDKVLIEFADRIKKIIRKSDTFARLGGDEFIIIVQNIKDENSLNKIARQIIHLTEKPFILKNKCLVSIGVSIGISVYPVNGTDIRTLLANADKAMYKSKQKGKNNFTICSD